MSSDLRTSFWKFFDVRSITGEDTPRAATTTHRKSIAFMQFCVQCRIRLTIFRTEFLLDLGEPKTAFLGMDLLLLYHDSLRGALLRTHWRETATAYRHSVSSVASARQFVASLCFL